MSESWKLELALVDPMGRVFARKAIGVDAFQAEERFVGITPPSEWDGQTFDQTVKTLRKKEYRKDILEKECWRLGRALGELLEDKEGWHGIDRQERVNSLDRQRNGY